MLQTPDARSLSPFLHSRQRPHGGAARSETKPIRLAPPATSAGVTLHSQRPWRGRERGDSGGLPQPLTRCAEQPCRGTAQSRAPTAGLADDALLGDGPWAGACLRWLSASGRVTRGFLGVGQCPARRGLDFSGGCR